MNCPNCGYDRTGVPATNALIRCPECGHYAPRRGWPSLIRSRHYLRRAPCSLLVSFLLFLLGAGLESLAICFLSIAIALLGIGLGVSAGLSRAETAADDVTRRAVRGARIVNLVAMILLVLWLMFAAPFVISRAISA